MEREAAIFLCRINKSGDSEFRPARKFISVFSILSLCCSLCFSLGNIDLVVVFLEI